MSCAAPLDFEPGGSSPSGKRTAAGPEFSVSPPNYLDWESKPSRMNISPPRGRDVNLPARRPQRVVGVTHRAYFDASAEASSVGCCSRRGRAGKKPCGVLSSPFWQRVFGGAATCGTRHSTQRRTVHRLGVAPVGFGLTSKVDVGMPMALKPDEPRTTLAWGITSTVGR